MPPAVTNLVLPSMHHSLCTEASCRGAHWQCCPWTQFAIYGYDRLKLQFPVSPAAMLMMFLSPSWKILLKPWSKPVVMFTLVPQNLSMPPVVKLTQRNVLLLVPPLLKVPFLTTSLILMNFGSLAGPLFLGQMILCPPPPWSYNVWMPGWKQHKERAIFHLHGTIVADVYPELVHNSLGALALIACQRLRLMRTNLLNYDPP